MSVLSDLAHTHTALSERDVENLHRLVADWQLLADLSFADLLLFVRVHDRDAYLIVAQVRPYPAQTLYQEDMVGTVVEAARRDKVVAAFAEHRIVREGDPEWREGIPIREEAIPVVYAGRAIAVVSAEQNLAAMRTPSALEMSYLQGAADLAQMIAEGEFPFPGEEREREISPRVGDGFLRLEADWTIRYASPNAVSAYHRLGVTQNLIGERLGALGIPEDDVVERLGRGRPVESEIERRGAWALRRFLPIVRAGRIDGALAFVRDITELRHRDRMLLLKDASIREIHHRVKNNLQTVAALLRLQSRRLASPEAKEALEQSVRRITSIALVHETLSRDSRERVDFDQVAEQLLRMAEDSALAPERRVRFRMEGSAGELPSQVATPLALALAELIQNAVQHAFVGNGGGEVRLLLDRSAPGLVVTVADNGVGLPQGFSIEGSATLGLQIVRTLVTGELGGEIEMGAEGGTRAVLRIPLSRAP